jgi:hypothetical protein
MNAWALLAVVATAADEGGPLLLTSGWQAVLEVPEVRAVAVDDPKLLQAGDVHDGRVTLLGAQTGQTNLWAYIGPPDSARVIHYSVVVTRSPTLLPIAQILSLTVDETRTLPLGGVSRVDVGDRSVCSAAVGAQTVELKARHAGTTTLLAWAGSEYRYLLISVRGGSVMPTADELDDELTEPADGRVVLRVGERGVYDMPDGLRWLALKDERVADVRLRDGHDLVFHGLRAGATHVLFWDQRGKRSARYIVVLPPALGDQNPVPPPPPRDPADEIPVPARAPTSL